MKISQELFNEIQGHIENKEIIVKKHPNCDLYIYNYTNKAQYQSVWTEATKLCRGLILDRERNIVARPFEKFFNLGDREAGSIPNDLFEVFEKMDGSLGILYWVDSAPCIATRGSFDGDQAVRGTKILRDKYSCVDFDKDKTYLFEIIYPENRIVVEYGYEDIVLLAVINKDGTEDKGILDKYTDSKLSVVKRYDGINDIEELKELEEENKEGFVVKFKSNNYRIKIKFQEYIRLHKVLTGVNVKSVWEYWKNGDIKTLITNVPDEFYKWVDGIVIELDKNYCEIENLCKSEFRDGFESRKDAAEYFKKCSHPPVLFKMLDGKDYNEVIKKMLQPNNVDVFKLEV